MYLDEIRILNYGAIEDLSYKMPFNANGNPQPVVLVGRNGVGKTLLLSNIIHTLIEMKRKVYTELKEVDGDNYYRVGSKSYIKNGKNYSYINYEFKGTSGTHSTLFAVHDTTVFINNEYDKTIHKNVNINDEQLTKNGFFDGVSDVNLSVFSKNIFLYFPVDRYYVPKWLNKSNENLRFITENEGMVGYSNTDMIRDNILEDIEAWILDVIIDMLIYEEQVLPFKENINGQNIPRNVKNGYNGKNTMIQDQINKILCKLFVRGIEFVSARIGISNKRPRKISILFTLKDGSEKEFVPTFANLSSGEIMVLALFCSILKEFDRVTGAQDKIQDISGIVLIDEIDLHLHSDFAKEVVPQIMEMFPKIQFIVSSHSPFFLLGMKDTFNDACTFLSLPTGTIMNNIENFEEIRKCYDMLDKNYQVVLTELEQHKVKIASLTKPLIITEGKTDWKHLKNALSRYKERDEFVDLDIEFWEYNNEDMGASNLETLLSNIAKLPNSHKIIGIFDDDTKTGKKYKPHNTFGNNVYGISISHPDYSEGISIELLYPESDIKLFDSDNRRLYLTNEFSEKKHVLNTDASISTTNKGVDASYKSGMVKIIDCGVYDVNENSIALSKDEFAKNVLNRVVPFDAVSIDGFRGVLVAIRNIISGTN
ncbi:MAG: hypothetical protein Ta2B_10290 [Termitinemataceae bacterium]|nr:MAG: hypothetical protein Ta2B_10290 [Termitinemataceae bacterium]